MLVVFSGLPGTGKTTIAQQVARSLRAVYLRVDVIEHALRRSGTLAGDVGPAGYIASYALAESNLALGLPVVADMVNPLAITRAAWHDIATRCQATLLDVEIICSDPAEHRRRVETRTSDIEGHAGPAWDQVCAHEYEPWAHPRLLIDTATMSASNAAALIVAKAAP